VMALFRPTYIDKKTGAGVPRPCVCRFVCGLNGIDRETPG